MSKELLDIILDKRRELSDLEREYSRTTPGCNNTECSFHRPVYQYSKCSWSVLVEECNGYIPIE